MVYIDDILITGRTEEEHLRTLDKVLQILEDAGMRLKKENSPSLHPVEKEDPLEMAGRPRESF